MSRKSDWILENPVGNRALASGQSLPAVRKACGQEVKQAVAEAGNRTCIELVSARSTRIRFAPLSAAMSTSFSSSRSCRGAIVALHALAEFCSKICTQELRWRSGGGLHVSETDCADGLGHGGRPQHTEAYTASIR
eukprot:scaffold4525_cov125-Isochrysis_galbana.AAC.8